MTESPPDNADGRGGPDLPIRLPAAGDGSWPPSRLPAAGDGSWPPSRLEAATRAMVALGLLVRLFRYASHYPLWGDEAALASNFLGRGYGDLLRPLDLHQVSPPLFLWVELTAVRLFGFSEWSLRLFPLASALISVFLFRHVAGRLLRGVPLLLAVGTFAVAIHPIRHAAEVKPYASDLLVALALLAPAVEWMRSPSRTGWLWGLAATMPVAMAVSQPAVFVAGGVCLGLLLPVWKSGRRDALMWYTLAVAAAALSFGGVFALHGRAAMQGAALEGMRAYWAPSFPPLGSPPDLGWWLVRAHTGSMFAYPDGGQAGGSTATALVCLIAIATWWRRGDRAALAMLLAPFALTLGAAALRRYPYGGEARIGQHLAPMICLLTGAGAAVAWRALPRPCDRARGLGLMLIGLVGLGLYSVGHDCVTPYRSDLEFRSREFARWFWSDRARGAELACARTDLGIRSPRPLPFLTGIHLCYHAIFAPPRPGGPRLADVSADHPLRCVIYDESPEADPAFVGWMASVAPRLAPRSVEKFVIASRDGPRRQVVTVVEFAPPTSPPTPLAVRETPWPPTGIAGAPRRPY